MFNQEHLSQIDKQYFNVIMLDGKDVTIQSRNTGHYWYLHCTEYPQDESLFLFHMLMKQKQRFILRILCFCFISIDFSIHIISMEEQIH